MTPADEMRQAATTLRVTGGQATEGPWIAEFSGPTGNCVIPHDAQSTLEYVAKTQLYHAQADAEFIALMDPGLAEPLAAWLEDEAEWAAQRHSNLCYQGKDGKGCGCFAKPLAIARQINTKRAGQ